MRLSASPRLAHDSIRLVLVDVGHLDLHHKSPRILFLSAPGLEWLLVLCLSVVQLYGSVKYKIDLITDRRTDKHTLDYLLNLQNWYRRKNLPRSEMRLYSSRYTGYPQYGQPSEYRLWSFPEASNLLCLNPETKSTEYNVLYWTSTRLLFTVFYFKIKIKSCSSYLIFIHTNKLYIEETIWFGFFWNFTRIKNGRCLSAVEGKRSSNSTSRSISIPVFTNDL